MYRVNSCVCITTTECCTPSSWRSPSQPCASGPTGERYYIYQQTSTSSHQPAAFSHAVWIQDNSLAVIHGKGAMTIKIMRRSVRVLVALRTGSDPICVLLGGD